ncbi:MAG: protein translocase subunit SecD [Planctomycetes bacterium]|nr:protein translocase subunit SecD [Planctomycetota bacterium]
MNERDNWWKIALVGTLIALAVGLIWPLDQKLKYGIDLYGGYSLLYEIDDSGLSGTDKANLAERVMKVLKERVDPKGVFNLVWRPIGHNRLEIQMPRPSEEVTKARDEFKRIQEQIQAAHVRRTDILRAVSKQGPDRVTALERATMGIGSRLTLLQTAATAYDEWKKMEADYDVRLKQIQADNLSRPDVEVAVKKSSRERAAALDGLIRGTPARRASLEEAAKLWEEVAKLVPTTQPSRGKEPTPEAVKAYDEKLAAFNKAVDKVLEANVDPTKITDGANLNKVVELEEKFDSAVAAILATNLDVAQLQGVLDAKPTDANRAGAIKQLEMTYPGLAPQIVSLVQANDQVRKQRRGEGRLEDPADLQRLLKGAGVLEFRILAKNDRSNPEQYSAYRERLKARGPRAARGDESVAWFEIEDVVEFTKIKDPAKNFEQDKTNLNVIVERFGDKYYVLSHIDEARSLQHKQGESDWSLKGAHTDRDEIGKPCIAFQLDEIGGDKFATLTRINKGEQLCIFLDDQAISHATIQSVIRTSGRITGNFQLKEVQEMVKKLDAGSLPKKLKDPPISVRSIGPSLGEANRTAGLTSAKYAAIAVAVFMIVYYYYAGGVAMFAVVLNVLFTFAAMALMGATFTLAGIAGLVLSVGMAVDANVLINERIREELGKGTALRMAIKLGYERAFSAILDSNVTTILTSLILYLLGSEEIKGFALTLGLGVFINLFTAIFVTHMMFDVMACFVVPTEVKRYPIVYSLSVAAAGAVLWGLGYVRNDAMVRDQSVLILFGKTLVGVAPGVIGVQIFSYLLRFVHMAVNKGGPARLPMQRWIGVPRFDWVGARGFFFALSIIVTIGGTLLFFRVPTDDLYDIEFLGGTAAQIDLKTPGSLNQTDVSNRLAKSGESLVKFSESISKADVAAAEGGFQLKTPGISADRLEPIIKSVFDKKLSQVNAISYSDPAAEAVVVRLKPDEKMTLDEMRATVRAKFAEAFKRAGESLANAQVQAVEAVGSTGAKGRSFEIVTLEKNKELVIGAIMETLGPDLDIQPKLSFNIVDDPAAGVPYYAIRSEDPKSLGAPLQPAEMANVDLNGWKNGVAILLDQITPPQRVETLKSRLRSMRLQPGFELTGWRESDVFGLTPASPGSTEYSRVMIVVADEAFSLDDQSGSSAASWASGLAQPEVKLVNAALTRQASLSQITQFDQQIADDARTNAYLAVVLSWLVIIVYLWFRFGKVRWGLAAVVALVHDVLVGLGSLGLAYAIAESPIGKALLIEKFRVDMSVVAALLTLIGYSVNDTIVVFDRVRELKGRMTDITPQMVNDSINQTLSRTLLTVLTVFITIVIMYIFGGRGIHGFNYVMIAGLLTGSYSSLGVATQFLIKRAVRVRA